MIIRPASEEDVPAILNLYQLSLGNTEGLRTEAYWRWKHQLNPFGPSPILLAVEDQQLVGLRAFLQWRFRYQGKSFQAYRAVDTATHPEFRGKGIFSTLTLQLIDQIKQGEPCLIYNTPNEQSKPGYFKMGWQVFGNTRLRVKVSPLNLVRHALGMNRQEVLNSDWEQPEWESTIMAWKQLQGDCVVTDYTMDYLNWRYRQMPAFTYQLKLKKSPQGWVAIVYRIKNTRYIHELRINEIFYSSPACGELIKSGILELQESHRPDAITVLSDADGLINRSLPAGFFKADSRGLTITYRKVNDHNLVSLAEEPARWYFSAGTLELF